MSPTALPREIASGVKEYEEILTWLVAKGPWRGTVTAYDWEYMQEGHASGGAISMLWHGEIGPLIAASLTQYDLKEPTNMQRIKDSAHMSLTPRLELVHNGDSFQSINDYHAEVTYQSQDPDIKFCSKGKLVNGKQKSPSSGEVVFAIEYTFREDSFGVSVGGDFRSVAGELRYYMPIVSDHTEAISRPDEYRMEIHKENKTVEIRTSLPMKPLVCYQERIFNHVPGFEAVPVYVGLNDESGCSIEIRIKEADASAFSSMKASV